MPCAHAAAWGETSQLHVWASCLYLKLWLGVWLYLPLPYPVTRQGWVCGWG